MKNAVAFLKKYGVIIACLVVAAAALVLGPLMGSRMGKGLQDEVNQVVSADYSVLGRTNVDYQVPRLDDPGRDIISESMPVHKQRTEHFKKLRDGLAAESASIWGTALERNREGHDVLVEGLFPKPSEDDKLLLPGEFAKAYINRFHDELLTRVNAGTPPDANTILLSVESFSQSQSQHIQDVQARPELSAEEAEQLERELRDIRLGRIRQAAAGIGLYATKAAFVALPSEVPQQLPELEQTWDWQQQAWIHTDIIDAIALANGEREGERGVAGSVVKRILRIEADLFGYGFVPQNTGGDRFGNSVGGGGGGGFVEPTPIVTPLFAASPTGRASGMATGNQYYDVRNATIDVIVSSQRLPVLLDAISSTNFMTVIECDIENIDPFRDLVYGYYYGDEAVVRAQIRVETLWLRDWTKDLIPSRIRTGLGIVDEQDPGLD